MSLICIQKNGGDSEGFRRKADHNQNVNNGYSHYETGLKTVAFIPIIEKPEGVLMLKLGVLHGMSSF